MTEPAGKSPERRTRPVAVPVAAVLVAAAVGVTAWLGGLDDRPEPPPQQLRPGQLLDQGSFAVRFVESKLVVERAKDDFGTDKRYLDVVLNVTNKTDETVNVGSLPSGKSSGFGFGSSLLTMTPHIPSEWGGELFVLSKGVKSAQLHPAVPATVVARYELQGSTQPPDRVSYELGAFEKLHNGLEDTSRWFLETEGEALEDVENHKVVATITLPVESQGA